MSDGPEPATRSTVWAAILVSGAGWGSEGVATRAAFNAGAGPYAVAAIRAAISAIGALIWVLGTRQRIRIDRVVLRQGIVQGAAQFAGPYVLLTFAYENASAGYVSLIVSLIPIVTLVSANAYLGERMSKDLVAGLLVALGGVAFLLLSGDSGLATGGRPLRAAVLSAGAVLLIALSTVYAKRDAHLYDAVGLTVVQMVFGAAILLVAMPLASSHVGDLNSRSWLLIIYLAVGATIVPYFTFFWSLKHATATLVSLSGYIVPLVAVVGGVTFLDEQLQPGIVGGGILILFGVYAANRAERRSSLDVTIPR